MELLDMLEARVAGLMAEVERLRMENQRIAATSSETVAARQTLQEENRRLRDDLAQEQQLKDEVLERIDALLARIKDLDNEV